MENEQVVSSQELAGMEFYKLFIENEHGTQIEL